MQVILFCRRISRRALWYSRTSLEGRAVTPQFQRALANMAIRPIGRLTERLGPTRALWDASIHAR